MRPDGFSLRQNPWKALVGSGFRALPVARIPVNFSSLTDSLPRTSRILPGERSLMPGVADPNPGIIA